MIITKFEKLKDLKKDNNLIIEGYNYVGKNYLINKLNLDQTHNVIDKKVSSILPEEIRWSYYVSYLSILDNFGMSGKPFIMNKSILSGNFYNQGRDCKIRYLISLDTVEYFLKLVKKYNIKIILIEVDRVKYKKFVSEQNDFINPDETYKDLIEFNTFIKKAVNFIDLKNNFYIYKNNELV